MRILRLTIGRDIATVHLIAVAIVERLSCEKLPALVASRAVCVPLSEYIKKQLGRFRLRSTIYVDETSIWLLSRLILRQSDMAILLIAKGD